MTKIESYRELQGYNSFLANVIFTNMKNSAKRLKGAIKLIKLGYEVDIASNCIDALMINGRHAAWQELEKVSLSKWDGKISYR